MSYIRKTLQKFLTSCDEVTFVDVQKAIHDKKAYIMKRELDLQQVFALTIWKENVNLRASMLVHILAIVEKDTVFTRGVKYGTERLKECAIDELR